MAQYGGLDMEQICINLDECLTEHGPGVTSDQIKDCFGEFGVKKHVDEVKRLSKICMKLRMDMAPFQLIIQTKYKTHQAWWKRVTAATALGLGVVAAAVILALHFTPAVAVILPVEALIVTFAVGGTALCALPIVALCKTKPEKLDNALTKMDKNLQEIGNSLSTVHSKLDTMVYNDIPRCIKILKDIKVACDKVTRVCRKV